MGNLNWSKVIVGGLVAGVIINVFEFVASMVMEQQWADYAASLNLSAEMTAGKTIMYLSWGFLQGLVIIWLYAAIRPRYGPGPKTAATAGLAVWLASYVGLALIFSAFMAAPTNLMLISMAIGIVEVVVASVAGAYLYAEPAAA